MSERTFNPFEELKTKTILETLGLLPRVAAFVFSASPFYFLLSNLMGLVQAGIAALILILGKVVVDRVAGNIGSEVEWLYLLIPMLLLICTRIMQSVLFSVDTLVGFLVQEKVQNKAHSRLLRKATSLDLAFFESPKFYDRLYQSQQNIGYLYSTVLEVISFNTRIFTMIAMVSILSILHPLAFVLLVVTISPRIIFEGYSARRRFDLDVEYTRNFRITEYYKNLLLEQKNIKEVMIYGLSDYFSKKYFELRSLFIRSMMRLEYYFVRIEVFFDILALTGIGLLWLYAIYRTSIGELTIGDLFMIFGAVQSCRTAIEAVFEGVGGVFENSLFLTRFFEMLDLDPNTVDGALQPPRLQNPYKLPVQMDTGIEFRNVSFRYPGTTDTVLKDISLVVPAGTKLAIVGENGAGKTTLIKLLARFYDPENGSILLDGRDYREYDLEHIRSNITVVFQDFSRYDISVSDNVGVGQVEYIADRERIVSAAKKGGSHEMAINLPSKYDTILGRTFDEGVDLSGGEWQNIAISRAFMSDAQIFILDEPTAALDAFKEAEIYTRFAELTENRTVVLVSHRFSTVRMADLIAVIDDGLVIEYGTHDELLRSNGKYHQMFEAQAARYR